MAKRWVPWAVGLGLLILWVSLALVDGLVPLRPEAGPAFFPPVGSIEDRPVAGEAWALLLGDSVFFRCPDRSGACPDTVLATFRACGASGALKGLRLASITSGGQTPFQYEAEAYRCSRLPSRPKRAFIEFNLRPFYHAYSTAQIGRQLPPFNAGDPTLGWDEDPFGEPELPSESLFADAKAWCLGLGYWTSDTVRLWLPTGAVRERARQPRGGAYRYDHIYGPGHVFEPAAFEAELRAGQRFREAGVEAVYFAVPQNWRALQAELKPEDLARLRGHLKASLARLRQAGFEVVDLSALLDDGFEPPPTQHEHLMRDARGRFAEALCKALP